MRIAKYIPDRVYSANNILYLYPKGYNYMELKEFVKERRKLVRLTQTELALKAGVGLRFMRELEQGKQTLRLDKVNQVLYLFGYKVGAIPVDRNLLTDEEG